MDNNTDLIIVSPTGTIVNLNDIRCIGNTFKEYEDTRNTHSGYSFILFYKGLNIDGYTVFQYLFKDYKDTPAELKIKVENIRLEIARRMNDGRDVKQVLGSIQLKK